MAGTLGAKERWVATGSIVALVAGMLVGEVLHRQGASGVVAGFGLIGGAFVIAAAYAILGPASEETTR